MTETVNQHAREGLQEPPSSRHTAAEKIMRTLHELSRPGPDAGELELTLATVALGIERGVGPQLEELQEDGQVDEFVLALTRFLATHRSDSATQLVVVELKRAPEGQTLPAGTKLARLDEAIAMADQAASPF